MAAEWQDLPERTLLWSLVTLQNACCMGLLILWIDSKGSWRYIYLDSLYTLGLQFLVFIVYMAWVVIFVSFCIFYNAPVKYFV